MSTIQKEAFGNLPDGTKANLYILRNANGMEARITNYGGIVVALTAPDRSGQWVDVVLGCPTLEGYLKGHPYFGALIGRYGNRIANGKFELNGQVCALAQNNGTNSLHGGIKGFDKVLWKARTLRRKDGSALELTYVSADGEEGFPGTLSVKAIYSLTPDNALKLEFTATTDKDTHCNLTHHSYFNLAGKGDVLGHVVQLNADKFTPVDANLIPTGVRPVAGTPFDFTKPTPIGERINQDDEQLKFGRGYDHNWVINQKRKGRITLAATVTEPTTGRVLEMLTTEPATQFYTGNFLDGSITGKNGWVYQHRNGFCLEPQHYPDSPNQPAFPTTLLKPGEKYRNTIIYRFSAK